MDWFKQLRQALAAYYPASMDESIVGYLQGSDDPSVWRQMEVTRSRSQMLVLGNQQPTQQEWMNAGVAHRGDVKTIRINALAGWIVLLEGYVPRQRPWGKLVTIDDDALKIGFPGALRSWQRMASRG
ncbi:hypothetical protein [Mesorhizobium sp. CN2-181]|uniref:hypothetical protein n=1 Tax=Mesorhizobium yinganensis TaxID=3157707 RepID=UPI0032B853D9